MNTTAAFNCQVRRSELPSSLRVTPRMPRTAILDRRLPDNLRRTANTSRPEIHHSSTKEATR
jgi:hypothetical protein